MKNKFLLLLFIVYSFSYSFSLNSKIINCHKKKYKINAMLIDFDKGSSSGIRPGAGIFIFKINNEKNKFCCEYIFVIIPSAINYKEDFFKIGDVYNLVVTKERIGTDYEIERFKSFSYPKFYCYKIAKGEIK